MAKGTGRIELSCNSGTLERLVSFGISDPLFPKCDAKMMKGKRAFVENGTVTMLTGSNEDLFDKKYDNEHRTYFTNF